MNLRMISGLRLNPVTGPGASLFFLLGCCGTAPTWMRLLSPAALPWLPAPGSPQLSEWLALAAPWQSKRLCPGVSVGAFRPVLRTFRFLDLYSLIKKSKTLLCAVYTENDYNPTCARQCLCSYAAVAQRIGCSPEKIR